MTRIEGIRKWHVPNDDESACRDCGYNWPCDRAYLLALVDELAGALSPFLRDDFASLEPLEKYDLRNAARAALARLQEQDRCVFGDDPLQGGVCQHGKKYGEPHRG